jgi:hypothetical protein
MKRIAAVVLALSALAAPAALAASSSSSHVVAHIDRSGTVNVSGYDGGAPLAP